MADTIAAPQIGAGEGVAPAAVSPPPAETEKPAQIVQQTDVPSEQPPQVEAKVVTDEVPPPPAAETPKDVREIKEDVKKVKEDAKEVKEDVKKDDTKVEEPKKEEVVNIGIKDDSSVQEVKPIEPAGDSNATSVEQNTQTVPSENDWQQRESELLKKIEELEKVKNEKSEDSLKLQLKVREEEIDLLKARVKNLETELQAALSKPGGKNHEMIEHIKQQHEELLSKAKGMIFDKTKMVKNQELQIEALTTQVQSLKDINLITKDLLEIRNGEVKAMEERLQAMEARFKTEKERYGLVLARAQTSSNINDDLKKEYVTQLAIFKELREKYEQRVKALVAENEKLKESVKTGAPAPSSSS